MSFSYPYKSLVRENLKQLREGQDYAVWQGEPELGELVAQPKAPIVEIGGPTDEGFFFLDGLELNSKPIITNISPNPAPYGYNAAELAEGVDELVDGRDMPYDDESIGIFLMASMSISSDWWVGLDSEEKTKAAPKFNKECDLAILETGRVALGVLRAEDVKYAQRVQIFREVYRTLRKGGLFFNDGGVEEIAILQKLGFKLVAFLQYRSDHSGKLDSLVYEFVVQK